MGWTPSGLELWMLLVLLELRISHRLAALLLSLLGGAGSGTDQQQQVWINNKSCLATCCCAVSVGGCWNDRAVLCPRVITGN